MAGGRRPASYVGGSRHNAGVERVGGAIPVHQTTSPPVEALPNGPSLPPWIPSIWRPAPDKQPQSSQSEWRAPSRSTDSTGMLAAALDSAVQSAVLRALGTPNETDCTDGQSPPATFAAKPDASAELQEVLMPPPSLVYSAREGEMQDRIVALEQRLQERDDLVCRLLERLEALEKRVESDSHLNQQQGATISSISSKLKAVSHSSLEQKRAVDTRISSVTDLLRTNATAIRDSRSAAAEAASTSAATTKRLHNVTESVAQLRATLSSHIERSTNRMDQVESYCHQSVKKIDEAFADISSGDHNSIEDLKKSVQSAVENLACLRSKLKRVESQLVDVVKQVKETSVLHDGIGNGLKVAIQKIQDSIVLLSSKVELLSNQAEDNSPDISNQDTKSSERVDALEANVKSLKKLIESSLRNQLSAEGIVKEQVSLITKHVCVAMRQYTSRRISENNTLIDQALRARVPEYAKNEDQFVLVREELPNGTDLIDIHKASELSSLINSSNEN